MLLQTLILGPKLRGRRQILADSSQVWRQMKNPPRAPEIKATGLPT